ncbi:TetR family transcriptional regulator [Actinoplanes sp. TRM 88003]|uniref:TetR family transcriptional regulator n=1 Tax=Paractinoplanes aksuensis TaxID=2939490 RepID=A0ABT1DFH2_9ACTN|nr:TetR family transcriptional regulator [Actinoplanes aksuensis]MCO8269233.1 TetR family transcriptional regulator [Actinoplanes aksuensis]
MGYDSAATRSRLLDAAYDEFVERGLAGARVDRIAAAAQANKQAIYAYFGSKENLFDAVLAARLGVLADEAPFDPDDLPGYAGALFDALAATPGLMRLTQWSRLERSDATPGEIESHRAKAQAVRKALDLPDDLAATDILEIVIAIATTWVNMPAGLKTTTSARQRIHRATVVAATEAIIKAL